MEFFRIKRDIPFMRYALVFNVISIITFLVAVGSLAVRGLSRAEALRHLSGNLSLIVQGDAEVASALAGAARVAGAVPFAELRFALDSTGISQRVAGNV